MSPCPFLHMYLCIFCMTLVSACQFWPSNLNKCIQQVTVEDFELVCRGLYRALCIREKYMQKSFQRFPKTPSQFLRTIENEMWKSSDDLMPGNCRQSLQAELNGHCGRTTSLPHLGWTSLQGAGELVTPCGMHPLFHQISACAGRGG